MQKVPINASGWLPLCIAALTVAGCAAVCVAQDTTQAPATVTVHINDVSLTVPTGIHVTKVAGEPLITWPVVADWDQQGRLVVVESGGVSRPIGKHNEQRLHRVVRLVDKDNDGTFDTRILAADQLPFAVGVLSVGNDLLVSAPPQILRLIDADDDGFCEQREVWYDPGTITGCANDLHGPYEGRDGWIYWTKGAFAEQTHDLPTGDRLQSSAAHIFRRRLEGGPVEPVMTGGMDNPVEVAFLPSGERFFTSTFLQHPRDGVRDGIAHAVYGGVYGKDHHVIDDHLRTGDLMPIMTQLDAAAPAGLAYLESHRVASQVFPDNGDVLAAALFNHHKVTLNRLTGTGADFRSESRDLLAADRIDFHPTEVIEDADGSLIVIDTGGWYDLCCPSSHVDQKTAAGGIYRLSAASMADKPEMTAFPAADASVDVLIAGLSAISAVTRRAAVARLIEHADTVTPALTARLSSEQATVPQKIDAVWALCRIGSPNALTAIIAVVDDETAADPLTSAAAHAISVHRWKPAAESLQRMVASVRNSPVRRTAAEALGRLGDQESVAPLMQAVSTAGEDRVLEHSLLYAIMETEQPDAVREYLNHDNPRQQRAALIVLDQTQPGTVPLKVVFAAARSADPALRVAALKILESRPESPPSAETLARINAEWLEGRDSAVPDAIVAGWAELPEIQSLVAEWIAAAPQQSIERQNALRNLLQKFTGNELPDRWSEPLSAWLADSDSASAAHLASFLRPRTGTLNPRSPLVAVLLRRASESTDSPQAAVTLLSALPARTPLNDTLAAVVVDAFLQTDNEPLAVSATAALERVRLPVNNARRLLDAIDHIAPLQLPIALGAINVLENDLLDADLLSRLKSVRSARTLTSSQVTNLYRHRSEELKQQAAALVEALQQPSPDIQRDVNEVLTRLHPGNRLKGYEVFRSSKAACSACHRIGYIGTSIGPELTHIGKTRTRYDLLEAILHPSARLEQSFQPVSVVTSDGRVHNGIVKNQSSDRFELITGPNQTITLNTADIEEQVPSEVSIMPKGLAEQISLDELSDLMALLEAAR